MSPAEYAAECDHVREKSRQRGESGTWPEGVVSRRLCNSSGWTAEPWTPEQRHEWQVRAAKRAIDAHLDEEQERLDREQSGRDDRELLELLKRSHTAGTLTNFNRKFLESCETEDFTWLQ